MSWKNRMTIAIVGATLIALSVWVVPSAMADSSSHTLRFRVVKRTPDSVIVMGHRRRFEVKRHVRQVVLDRVDHYRVVRRTHKYVVLRFISTGPSGTVTPTTVPTPQLRLVWSDEFTGPAGSAPAATKWHLVRGVDAGNELAYYTDLPTNAALDGHGHLAITARREPYGGAPYTSAKIQTSGLFSTTYGSIQARIKIPAGHGLWPAFWALGADYRWKPSNWPTCGEIDVFENLGKDPATIYYGIHGPTVHASAKGWHLGGQKASSTSLASGFHIYGLDWSRDSVRVTLDGVRCATYSPSQLSAGQTWVFNKPFWLILNLAVGGTWPGSPTQATRFPATMRVDWVRVYSQS